MCKGCYYAGIDQLQPDLWLRFECLLREILTSIYLDELIIIIRRKKLHTLFPSLCLSACEVCIDVILVAALELSI